MEMLKYPHENQKLPINNLMDSQKQLLLLLLLSALTTKTYTFSLLKNGHSITYLVSFTTLK